SARCGSHSSRPTPDRVHNQTNVSQTLAGAGTAPEHLDRTTNPSVSERRVRDAPDAPFGAGQTPAGLSVSCMGPAVKTLSRLGAGLLALRAGGPVGDGGWGALRFLGPRR